MCGSGTLSDTLPHDRNAHRIAARCSSPTWSSARSVTGCPIPPLGRPASGNAASKLARSRQCRTLYDPVDEPRRPATSSNSARLTFAEWRSRSHRACAPGDRRRCRHAAQSPRGNCAASSPNCPFADRQWELYRMHATGEYSISDLRQLVSVSRPTVLIGHAATGAYPCLARLYAYSSGL